jgi:hypothetical protein
MLTRDIDWDRHPPTVHRARAAALRAHAEQLGRAGERDQAARQLLEARLHDLKAAAAEARSRAA